MSLESGVRLGVYEILSPLGAGGMGEVYRARDTKLNRDVAIKILPDALASDRERLMRFEREAQTLAALHHPHIATIFGLQELPPNRLRQGSGGQEGGSPGSSAIVMELVEGPTLAERIAQGPIPTTEALSIAQQIADALDAAHEKGIVHRDLKPANIKVAPDGTVKVLDFGLAKDLAAATADVSMSPTFTAPATQLGVILGTAAYMAPEQARGKSVDKRADVWAFGCVLFEMLGGRQPFTGETVSETLAEVLKSEPPWATLPAGLPPRVAPVLRRCLEKEPGRRMRDIGDVRLALEGGLDSAWVAEEKPVATRRRAASRAIASVSLAIVAAAAAAAGYAFRPSTETPPVRFTIDAPAGMAFQGTAPAVASSTGSISPDGRRLVFPVRNDTGAVQLWVRELVSLTARPLTGTDGAAYQFWSADSQSVGYFAGGKLYRVDLAGGRPTALAEAPAGRGGTWSRNGVILFSNGPVHRIPAFGGEAVPVTRLSSGEAEHSSPFFLPDEQHFLFSASKAGARGSGPVTVYAADLNSGDPIRLLEADTKAVATPGYLLFVRQGTLLAQPFDAAALVLTGDPVVVVESVAWDTILGGFSVSQNGTLIYRTGPGPSAEENLQLAWIDRTGKQMASIGAPAKYAGLNISPNGSRVAIHRHEADGGDVWLLDLSSSAVSRLTFGPDQDNSSPVWSPDGTRIVFASRRADRWGMYSRRADGAGDEELLVEGETPITPMSWSPDSKVIVYGMFDPKTKGDLWIYSSKSRAKRALIQTGATEENAQISPDGKWIAFSSDETGRSEVYVRPFPSLAGRWQVSSAGGFNPRWRADSRELFFFDGTRGTLQATGVVPAADAAFAFALPRPLFNTGYFLGTAHVGGGAFGYTPSADGNRFLLPKPSSATGLGSSSPIVVVINWTAGLR